MNNNSFVTIPVEKLAALIETGCPPVPRTTQVKVCIEYDGDCKECWKSWLKDGE